MDALLNDPDILAEALEDQTNLPIKQLSIKEGAPASLRLNVINQSHVASEATAALAEGAGGLDAFRRATNNFYQKAFADPHIDKFIRSHDDPHGERFATWIAEKMGLGRPWTEERRNRPRCPFHAPGVGQISVHDRSSAHFAAWHSPKREAHKMGDHFDLEDARIWMRLHFWAFRETGFFDAHTAFAEYYVKFIAHFVSVYERTAPQFARESARWSADPTNTQRYLDGGRVMPDVKVSAREAIAQLPPHERGYTGSVRGDAWPYR